MNALSSLLFPPFRLELDNAQLWREGRAVPLRRKTFAVLRYLVEQQGQLVTKEQLFKAVWARAYVEEVAVAICIRELRKALGDDTRTPRFIETVHGRGYRFLPAVTAQPVPSARFQVSNLDTRPAELRTQPSVLVGREAERERLHGWLDKALNGERQIIFVTGEPGIGKTTVVEAFLERIEGELWIGRGQCIEHYGAGEVYMPILEALGRLCREPGGTQLMELLEACA